ncbi:uncharacterized protein METZ01_LOCUS169145 [marine metagenome]|jgi:hypothetical protein|uniref:Uncharacterized protein n=1 Tax=marine metagenome TaxID=408172 RepID=A0A382BS02_9ZZZZ
MINEESSVTSDTMGVLSDEAQHIEEVIDQVLHDLEHKKIFGIPEDIFLVLAIDAILISLRLSNKLKTGQFIGAKAVGTGVLIGSHLV